MATIKIFEFLRNLNVSVTEDLFVCIEGFCRGLRSILNITCYGLYHWRRQHASNNYVLSCWSNLCAHPPSIADIVLVNTSPTSMLRVALSQPFGVPLVGPSCPRRSQFFRCQHFVRNFIFPPPFRREFCTSPPPPFRHWRPRADKSSPCPAKELWAYTSTFPYQKHIWNLASIKQSPWTWMVRPLKTSWSRVRQNTVHAFGVQIFFITTENRSKQFSRNSWKFWFANFQFTACIFTVVLLTESS